MKSLLPLLIAMLLFPLALVAQNSARSDYQKYLAERQQAFKQYVDSRNAEYIRYMKQKWSPAVDHPAEVAKPQPKPVLKPVSPTEPKSVPVEIEVSVVVPKPTLPKAPAPTPSPAPAPTKSASAQVTFNFLGAACRVAEVSTAKQLLSDVSEQAVAVAWEALSAPDYRNVVADCQRIRTELGLADWPYLKLLETLATTWYAGRENEATLFQIFLLTQSGYKVRMARAGGRLVMLIPSSEMIYGYRYIQLGSEKCYVIGNRPAPDGYHVFDRAFPQERVISLRSTTIPKLPLRSSLPRKLLSKQFPTMTTEISVNLNLMDLYSLYPGCDMPVYAEQSFSEAIKGQLYPRLKQAIAGKSAPDAAAMLLDFVQTALEYKTDQEQFGYERPLFVEETLYYPYCDCEDRAMLYARLVRELLNLDVVLLQYPEHLATAVQFKQEVAGDYLMVSGKRYTVCDPTYIGAGVGRTMPGMNNKTATVILW